MPSTGTEVLEGNKFLHYTLGVVGTAHFFCQLRNRHIDLGNYDIRFIKSTAAIGG